jgi:hypothetical protein
MKQSVFLTMFLMGLLIVGHNFAQTSKRPNILVILSFFQMIIPINLLVPMEVS